MGEVCECLHTRMKKRSVTAKGRGGKGLCAGAGLRMPFYYGLKWEKEGLGGSVSVYECFAFAFNFRLTIHANPLKLKDQFIIASLLVTLNPCLQIVCFFFSWMQM